MKSHAGASGSWYSSPLPSPAPRGRSARSTLRYQAIAIVAPAIAKATAAEPTTPKVDPAWQKYVGVYTWEDDEIHVAVLDGKLSMIDPSDDNPWEGKTTLEPVSGNVFKMKDGDQAGETVTFILDASGKVTRFEAPGYYLLRRP